MRRLAPLLMLLLSLTPSVALMDDDWDDDDWGYYSDVGYVGYVADSDTVRVVDENGDAFNMRLMFLMAPRPKRIAGDENGDAFNMQLMVINIPEKEQQGLC